MPNKPKDKKLPTYEDIQRELGYEKMSFMSEMLRPDAEDEREEGDEHMPTVAPEEDILTPEHKRAIVEHIEKEIGRKLTPQEINLALEQARSI